MTFLRLMLLAVATASWVVEGRNHTVDKFVGIQEKIDQPCTPTACTNGNPSCPLIPDVLCASDECGCNVTFIADVNQTGPETVRVMETASQSRDIVTLLMGGVIGATVGTGISKWRPFRISVILLSVMAGKGLAYAYYPGIFYGSNVVYGPYLPVGLIPTGFAAAPPQAPTALTAFINEVKSATGDRGAEITIKIPPPALKPTH